MLKIVNAKLKKIFKSITAAIGIIVKKATEACSSMILKQQDTMEKQSEASFDALN